MNRKHCTALAAVLVLALTTPARATPPRAPVAVEISRTATVTTGPAPAVTLQVTLTVEPPAAIRLRLFVRPETRSPVDEALAFDEIVRVERSVTRTVVIPLREAGDFRANAIAELASGSVSGGASVYVRVTEDGKARVFSPAEFGPMHAREVAARDPHLGLRRVSELPKEMAPRALRNASVMIGTGTITGAADDPIPVPGTPPQNTLALSGHIDTKTNGVRVPMANVEVQVWDSDSPPFVDDLLGTTMTDAKGDYRITVANKEDIPLGGGVDVYLYIYSEWSNIAMFQYGVNLEGEMTPYFYAWRSPTRSNITRAKDSINFTIKTQAEAAAVWMGGSRASYLVATSTGEKLDRVDIQYPVKGTTLYRPKASLIKVVPDDPGLGGGDSPEVVAHEYGHAVMHQAYGTPSEGGPHSWCFFEETPGLAWSEGFATALGLVVGNDGGIFHYQVGDTGLSIENWSCLTRELTTDEGRIAAALWDLYDSANDDNGGNPDRGVTGNADTNQGAELVTLRQILLPLWSSVQKDVNEYWKVLEPTLNEPQKAPSQTIMTYNYYGDP